MSAPAYSNETLTKKSLEKLPPFNIEAEQAILGALLLDNTCLADIAAILDPEDFYRHTHETIFKAMRAQIQAQGAVDLLILRDALDKPCTPDSNRMILDEVGGPAYLAALVDQVPTAANVRYHAQLVREKAILRRLLNQSIKIALDVYGEADASGNLIRTAKDGIDGLFRQTFQGKDVFWVQDKAGIATEIDKDKYLEFLFHEFGFAMLDINDTTVFVQRQANTISLNKWVKSTNKTIKRTLKAYCKTQRRPDVWAKLLDKNELFSHTALTGLDTLDNEFVRDTADTCRLFFANGVAAITATSVTFQPYRQIQGYIWEDMISEHAYTGRYNQTWLTVLRQDVWKALKAKDRPVVNVVRRIIAACQHWIKDHGPLDAGALDTILRQMIDAASDRCGKFIIAQATALMQDEEREIEILESYWQRLQPQKSEYQQFLEYVAAETCEDAGGAVKTVNNLAGFEFALAYLLHQHNNPANMRAVILADSNPSFVSNGRRGKKIILDALKHLRGKRSVIKEDGKAFQEGRFKFQRVQPNTRIIILDDVGEDFEFKLLYSCITDGLVYEGKGVKAGAFDFDDNPKFAITTNHPCFGEDISSSERSILLPVSDHFVKIGRTPYQVFGHLLFDDWDQAEWDRFNDYMIDIIQRYLQRPDPSVIPVIDLTIFNSNKLLLKVPEPMVNYLDSLKPETDYEFEQIKLDLDGLGVKFRTSNEMTKALHTYCRLRNFTMKSNMKDGRYMSGSKRFLHMTPVMPNLFAGGYKKGRT